MFAVVGTIALAVCSHGEQNARAEDARTFQTGIVGSAPAGANHPTIALSSPEVRALVLDVARSPVAVEVAAARLAGSSYEVNRLVRLGLFNIRNGRVALAFNYLSAGDQRRIATAARRYARDLADRLLANRDALESTASTLARTPGDLRRVLFFVIGCMALDWDGLAFTAEAGYRTRATVSGESFAYTPWMKENAPDISRRGLYWGSHNARDGEYTFTTFGDHHALPRLALPDMQFRGDSPFPLRTLARIMVAAREGSVTGAEAEVAFLKTLGYLGDSDGRVDARVPVLLSTDRDAIRRVISIVRSEVEAWHRDRYAALGAELDGLTARRHGVPFGVVYTEVWHYVFGYANLYLSQAGLVADPYGPDTTFRGFVPVLWHSSLSR